jgi:hypothetical protein
MTDRNTDRDKKPAYDTALPADEEFDEEPDESAEPEGEGENEGEYAEGEGEYAEEGAVEAVPAGRGRRFGFGRAERVEEEAGRRPVGSVRESHERVHVDDRPSAIYALVCACGLLLVLGVPWLGGLVPQAASPTLTPLVVPTGQPTVASSASPSIAVSPSPSPSPSPTPSPVPTASTK